MPDTSCPPSRTSRTCRSCGAPIVWGRLRNEGGWVPLDAEPHVRGQMILLDGQRCHPVDPAESFTYGEDVQARRHWDHRTTCGLPGGRRTTVLRRVTGNERSHPGRERIREVRLALDRARDTGWRRSACS